MALTAVRPRASLPVLAALMGGMAGALLPSAIQAQEDAHPVAQRLSRARAHEAAGREAAGAGDLTRYREEMAAAYALRPGHQTLLYHWARGYAAADSVARAVEILERYADMGFGGDLAADEIFAPLSDDDAGRRVLARIRDNDGAAGEAGVVYRHPVRGYMPEGVAYDPVDGVYYLGSVRHDRIDAIVDGRARRFADATGGVLWSVMGMAVDAPRRLLWVATSAVPQGEPTPEADHGRSALVAFDLTGARSPVRYEVPADGADHWVGDVTVAEDGTVYATDSASGDVYRVRPGGGLETVLEGGILPSAQGLALSADGQVLYVADYALGLLTVDLATGALSPLEVPPSISVLGIDGMRRVGDALVVIQNGIRPHRVLALSLSADGDAVTGSTLLLSGHPAFPEPTLGTVVDGGLVLVANSQWFLYDEEAGWPADEEFVEPVLLRVALPGAP